MILVGELLSAEAASGSASSPGSSPPDGAARPPSTWRSNRGARPLAVREAKRLVDLSRDLDLDAGLAAELDASERVFRSEDMLEGARAFFEKRPPRFSGR
jgi:enoyl-CoA hydratase/carnithine racemase